MQYDLICALESDAGRGEDCYLHDATADGALLCVADGCGGLGAERYEAAGGHTGAYLASRLAVECVCEQALAGLFSPFPGDRAACAALRQALADGLGRRLQGFAESMPARRETRVVGSLRRELPTTFCLGVLDASRPDALDGACFWAGDSRAYLLSRDGLRLLTADHARLSDPGYHGDAPLTNLLSADRPFALSVRRFRQKRPGAVLLATDGAYGAFPTPMRWERALLETLWQADGMAAWRAGLTRRIRQSATDDATLLLSAYGYDSFAALRADLCAPLSAPEEDWASYRERYDHTEGGGAYDWRI